MNRTIALIVSFSLGLLFLIPALQGQAEELSGADIIARVKAHPTPKSSAVRMKMTLIKMRGTREEMQERTVQIVGKDSEEGGKSLLRFIAPADIKGVGLLVVAHKGAESEQWLYMPSLGKASRISGSQKKGSFMGTDFTYEDLEPADADAGNHVLVQEEVVNGQPAWLVESTPKEQKDSSYSKIRQWIRKDVAIPIKAEFFDRAGVLLKVLVAEEITEDGGYWTARRTVMENVRKKSKTVLEILEQKNDIPVPDEMFTERMLTKG